MKIINRFKKIIKKPTVERSVKTFIEVFSSYIAVNIMTIDLTNKVAIEGLIAGAIGSAISVVLNIRKEVSNNV